MNYYCPECNQILTENNIYLDFYYLDCLNKDCPIRYFSINRSLSITDPNVQMNLRIKNGNDNISFIYGTFKECCKKWKLKCFI